MSASTLSAEQLEYQVQIRLLNEKNKDKIVASGGIVPVSTLPDEFFKGRIGNLFEDGRLVCTNCLNKMRGSDSRLWTMIQAKVHLPAPENLKTLPELHQCFCGKFCMLEDQIKQHYAANPINSEQVTGLILRVEQVGMHERCQHKLVSAMKGISAD